MSEWPLTFTTDSVIDGDRNIDTNETITTGVISQNSKQSTEISIDIPFNSSSSRGVTIYILRKKDNSQFQTITDHGLKKIDVGVVQGDVINTMFTIRGSEMSQFKITIKNNDANHSVIAPILRYQQSEGECLLVE